MCEIWKNAIKLFVDNLVQEEYYLMWKPFFLFVWFFFFIRIHKYENKRKLFLLFFSEKHLEDYKINL